MDHEVRGYRITGVVQGVGFRWFTQRSACALGVKGTVRNAEDGSVEVVAVAPARTLERFEAELARGPNGARVRAVERESPSDAGPFGEFRIVR